jgi:hypothetical protein
MNSPASIKGKSPPPSPVRGTVAESPASTARVYVYAGPHYGLPHFVLARQAAGREMKVQHLDGKPFTVHICDTEPAPIQDESSV